MNLKGIWKLCYILYFNFLLNIKRCNVTLLLFTIPLHSNHSLTKMIFNSKSRRFIGCMNILYEYFVAIMSAYVNNNFYCLNRVNSNIHSLAGMKFSFTSFNANLSQPKFIVILKNFTLLQAYIIVQSCVHYTIIELNQNIWLRNLW